jgi:hypothetical protein
MDELTRFLDQAAASDPICRALVPVLREPTGSTSAGRPYLTPRAWERLRDTVPHLLGMGQRVLDALRSLQSKGVDDLSNTAKENLERACAVVRQVALTASITAPPDLWLLRHVLGWFAELGLLARMRAGEAIYPDSCDVLFAKDIRTLHPGELDKDLQFLLARGLVEPYDDAYRMAGHPRVAALFDVITPLPSQAPASLTHTWRTLFSGTELDAATLELLIDSCQPIPRRKDPQQTHWIPTHDEVELGFRLLPIVLALRSAGLSSALEEGARVRPEFWSQTHPVAAAFALEILTAAGFMRREGAAHVVTTLGARGFAKGPGPFGIIETYHPYMQRGRDILLEGPKNVWVARSENVGASQDANRATFTQANDALDAFCRETGFQYSVFVEHAIGRGEATRQRFQRSGDALAYVGADLEDAAIDAAIAEQERGVLPRSMRFVRHADIGKPSILTHALREAGLDPNGAVMLVGNGFHEVRGQTDEGMIEVFRGYHDAGIVLAFTEESALSVDDLRATAFNTYHAGFRYVHDKSGQALRPAEPTGRPERIGRPLLAAWSECARRAGYVRLPTYSRRTRTIYPTTPARGTNPAISVNHFVVPLPIAQRLGVT